MTAIKYEASSKAMADYRALLQQDSEIGAKTRLIVEYARREGGDILAYWQLKKGPLFGKTTMASMEQCAKELDLPLSRVVEINSQTWDWVADQVEHRRSA